MASIAGVLPPGSLPPSRPPRPTKARSTAPKHAARAAPRGGLIMERSVDLDLVEEVVATQFELTTSYDLNKEFADYAAATEQLEDLEQMQRELSSVVSTMDSMLLQPEGQQAPQAPSVTVDERRAKRLASRAARKSSQVSAVQAAPVQPVDQPAGEASTSSVDDLLTADLAALSSLTQQLNAIFERSPSVSEPQPPVPTTPAQSRPPSASTSSPVTATIMSATVSKPALESVSTSTAGRSGPSLAGPALLGPALAGPSLRAAAPAAGARSKQATRATRNTGTAVKAATESVVAPKTTRTSTPGDGTSAFMKNTSYTSLLVGDQHKELATIVKDYLWLRKVEHELSAVLKRKPTMSEWAGAVQMDESRFAARLMNGQNAKAVMLKANYRLVISIVKKYQGRGMTMQDLITEGMQGLLRGVEKYDADKGFKFSTYAHWWIRQAVQRGVQQQVRTVRLPVHLQELFMKIVATKAQLTAKLSREPALEEIAEAVGMSVDRIQEIQTAVAMPTSLDVPVGDSSTTEVKDTLADERLTPDEMFANEMLRQNLEEVLSELDDREAGILRMRWGLDGSMMDGTLEDIGQHFNVTRERVRQIEARALFKLQERHRVQSGAKAGDGIISELGTAPMSKGSRAARQSRGTRKS